MPVTKTSGQGRPKGALNKVTKDIKLAAREFGVPAIARLAQLSGLMLPDKPGAESEGAQIAAIKELLDRGYGKATQPLSGDPDGPPLAVDFRWADALPPTIEAIENDETPAITVTFVDTTTNVDTDVFSSRNGNTNPLSGANVDTDVGEC